MNSDRFLRPRRLLLLTLTGLLTVLLGCARPMLRPAPEASVQEHGATAQTASVSVSAQTDEWNGTPDDIDGYLPIRLRLTNERDHPVRVRYEDLQLTVGDVTVTPTGPRAIEGTAYASIYSAGRGSSYSYDYRGFHLAPHHFGLTEFAHRRGIFGHGLGHGRGFGHGGHAFGHRGLGFGHGGHGFGFGYGRSGYGGYGYGSTSRSVQLPTRDMLLAALPEGFLEPGGRVEGFVYFSLGDEALQAALKRAQTFSSTENGSTRRGTTPKEAAPPARLTVTVVHSETGETLGEMSIPFVYDG